MTGIDHFDGRIDGKPESRTCVLVSADIGPKSSVPIINARDEDSHVD